MELRRIGYPERLSECFSSVHQGSFLRGEGREEVFSMKAHYERQSCFRRLAAELEVSRERCEMQSRVQECADSEQVKDRVSFPNSHQSVTECASLTCLSPYLHNILAWV